MTTGETFRWRNTASEPPPRGVSVLGFVDGPVELREDPDRYDYGGVPVIGAFTSDDWFVFDEDEDVSASLSSVPLWSHIPTPTDAERGIE